MKYPKPQPPLMLTDEVHEVIDELNFSPEIQDNSRHFFEHEGEVAWSEIVGIKKIEVK